MNCGKAKYKSLVDFPKEYHALLFAIDAKEDVVDQLMKFQKRHRLEKEKDPTYTPVFDWDQDIIRLATESSLLLSRLPKEIFEQYSLYRKIKNLLEEAGEHMSNGELEKAKECWKQAKELECCGKEDHCG